MVDGFLADVVARNGLFQTNEVSARIEVPSYSLPFVAQRMSGWHNAVFMCVVVQCGSRRWVPVVSSMVLPR
jgi:hypothetical protein